MDDNETPDETPMFLVWFDTSVHGNVVQFIRRVYLQEARARKYVRSVNSESASMRKRNNYLNTVAWYEEVLFDQEFLDEQEVPVDSRQPKRSVTRRLTADEVQKIRELLARQVPVSTIAVDLDISRQTVYQVGKRNAHKAV